MTGRHHDIKPENVAISHQASDTEHLQPSPWNSNAWTLEELNDSLDGRPEAPSVADGSWLPNFANLDPNYLEPQVSWQWQGRNNTTLWPPESANANLKIRTQDVPYWPRSTSPNLTTYTDHIRPGGLHTPEPQTLPRDHFPSSNTSLYAPYHSTPSALCDDHTEALIQGPPPIKVVDSDEIPHQAYDLEHRPDSLRHSHPRPRKELDKVLRTIKPTAIEDVAPSSQLDEDAHSTNVEDPGFPDRQPSVHNEPKDPFVLLEPPIETSSFPGMSSKSLICQVCNKGFRTRADLR